MTANIGNQITNLFQYNFFIMQNDIFINTIFRMNFYFINTHRGLLLYINIWDCNVNAEIKDQHSFNFL